MTSEVGGIRRTRLLVTGVGGDLGQGLVKALRLNREAVEIHGCDMGGAGAGAAFVDSFHAVRPADAAVTYIEEVDRLCALHGIEAVVPGSPAEIDALGCLGSPPTLPSGLPVVCLPAAYRQIYGDNLRCYEALEGRVELAPYADGADPEEVRDFVKSHGFPLVVKQRRGRGGSPVHVVFQVDQLGPALAATPGPVLQGYIDDFGGEFSIGVFGADGGTTAIAFRRRPGRPGSAGFTETVDDAGLLAYGRAVAEATGLRGSADIRVRKSSSGIRLLGVDARFSGLAPARAYAGFRDLEWSAALALGRDPGSEDACYHHYRFQSVANDLVDDGSGFVPVSRWTPGTPTPSPRRRVTRFIKRSMDVALSLLALILLAPVMAVVALAIRIGMGRPVFFLQRRPGRDGRPFTLLKFRTMLVGDAPNEERTTRLGGFLRSASLDELPQLWNVLRGEMSLVGPRPLMMRYLGRYTRGQARRHEVRPGITGWAQVNGRNTLDWDERFKLDVWYVDNATILLDLQILLRTVKKVFCRSGVAAFGAGIETEFMGSRPETGKQG